MKTTSRPKSTGYVLIEALVALIVVAVGVLGVAKLNSLLLQGTGVSKTRAEAMTVAQDAIEAARNFDLSAGCSDLTDYSSSFDGVTASFAIDATYAGSQIEVCVSWGDGNCANAATKDTDPNTVVLRSLIGCDGMGSSAQVGAGGATGSIGGFIKTPTGRAVMGGGQYDPSVGDSNKITLDDGTTLVDDGTKTYRRDDGAVELIGSDGKVLLTVDKLGCEDEAPDFSTISGKVYVAASNGSPIAAASDLFVLSSDASYCAKLPYQNDRVLPTGATGNSIKYFYTYYKCYVGAEWWGNIGLVRVDNVNASHRVCVGNPISANIGTSFSKHAQLGTTRAYRAYRKLNDDPEDLRYDNQGIGETADLNAACSTTRRKVYDYISNNLENHHFVHTVITGQASDASCATELANINGYAPTGSLGTAPDTAPVVISSIDTKTITASHNPGKYYCMSNDDGITCPDLINPPNTSSVLLKGTITPFDGAEVTGILTATTDPEHLGPKCANPSLVANGDGSFSYSCLIRWEAHPGTEWNGVLGFITNTNGTNGTICTAGTAPTVSPDTAITYTINDKDAAVAPNAVDYQRVPSSVTEIVLDLHVKQDTCGTLGQVNMGWNAGPNAWKILGWNTITNAISYEVQRCTTSSTATLTTCLPTTVVTRPDPSALIYDQGDPSNRQTICVRTRASDGGTTGPWSSTRCIHKAGNAYTYQ